MRLAQGGAREVHEHVRRHLGECLDDGAVAPAAGPREARRDAGDEIEILGGRDAGGDGSARPPARAGHHDASHATASSSATSPPTALVKRS